MLRGAPPFQSLPFYFMKKLKQICLQHDITLITHLQVANNLSRLLTCSGIWLTVCMRRLIIVPENAGTCCSLHLFSKMFLYVPPAQLQDRWIPPAWDWGPLTLYSCSHHCRNQIQEPLQSALSSAFPVTLLVLYMIWFSSCGSKRSCSPACFTLLQMMWYSYGP